MAVTQQERATSANERSDRRSPAFSTKESIETVAQTADNNLHAHRITLTYSRLAQHLDELIDGHDPERRQRQSLNEAACNANWFHFATWANRTVTHNIGSERAPSAAFTASAAPTRRRLTPASSSRRLRRASVWPRHSRGDATDLRRHLPHTSGVLRASGEDDQFSTRSSHEGLEDGRQDHKAHDMG